MLDHRHVGIAALMGPRLLSRGVDYDLVIDEVPRDPLQWGRNWEVAECRRAQGSSDAVRQASTGPRQRSRGVTNLQTMQFFKERLSLFRAVRGCYHSQMTVAGSKLPYPPWSLRLIPQLKTTPIPRLPRSSATI